MGITTVITLASLVLLGVLSFFVPIIRDFLVQVLESLRRGFEWFINTAPKPVTIFVFLFLVLFLGNFISSFLDFGYACQDGGLREIDGGLLGGIAFMFGSITIDDNDGTICSGSPSAVCGDFDNDTGLCQSVGCIKVSSCFGTLNSCDGFNGDNDTCTLVGCTPTASGNASSLDTYIEDRTSPAVTYSGDTPENLLIVSCINDNPRWTLRGFDFLAYRNVFILLLFAFILWLYLKLRELRNH